MTDKHPFHEQLAEGAKGTYVLCVACRRIGHCRLGVVSKVVISRDRSLTRMKCPPEYEGGPGVAHGGWTASVLDEMLGHLALGDGLFTVTSKLSVEYLKPVPIERDLEGYAWVESRDNGRWHVGADLRLVGSEKILARATGLFIERDLAHFKRHKQWLSDQTVSENAKG